jgi:hypothetical protein
MHIILDFAWTRVRKNLKKRLLILDEAWYLTKYEDSASFVYGIAKRARKYYLALTTATQDVQDFLSTDCGKAILSNSSIQILLKQSPTEIDIVSQAFHLTEGEKDLLTSVGVGEGLFFAGQNHVVIKILAAPYEKELATSNPQEVQEIRERQRIESLKSKAAPQAPPAIQFDTSSTLAPQQANPPTEQSSAAIAPQIIPTLQNDTPIPNKPEREIF